MSGLKILQFNIGATVLFVMSAITAAVVFEGFAKSQGVAVDLRWSCHCQVRRAQGECRQVA